MEISTMRHRAKCKLCGTVIDTEFNDYTSCACGEIAFESKNDNTMLISENFHNAIMIDSEGDEHPINVIEKSDISSAKVDPEGNFDTPEFALNQLIEKIEGFPQHGMTTYINHYDYLSLLYLLKALVKKD
jgi:hypothetical protein